VPTDHGYNLTLSSPISLLAWLASLWGTTAKTNPKTNHTTAAEAGTTSR